MNTINLNNQVMLRGHLVKDVQVSLYNDAKGNQKSVGRFTLAVKSGVNRNEVEFIPVTIFSGADVLAKYTRKGSQILVSCMLKNNTYEKKVKGKTETVYGGLELVCQGFEFLSSSAKPGDVESTDEDSSKEK